MIGSRWKMVLSAAVVIAFGCSKSPDTGVCAEGNGDPCTCADGAAGTYDCGHECQCGSCVPGEGAICTCDDGGQGTYSCDGTCVCGAPDVGTPSDMQAPADVGAADDFGVDASGTVDAGADMSTTDDRVMIPAGLFTMGCDAATCDADEMPSHDVTLSDYWIDRTEVSQSAFQACVDAAACTAPSSNFDPATTGDYPAVAVTFAQAQAYCQWAGGRLPTEAEWERAWRSWLRDSGSPPACRVWSDLSRSAGTRMASQFSFSAG